MGRLGALHSQDDTHQELAQAAGRGLKTMKDPSVHCTKTFPLLRMTIDCTAGDVVDAKT